MDSLTPLYALGFALSFYVVIKSADVSIDYVTRLARLFDVSEFAISFLIVGVVTALPEGSIGFAAAAHAQTEIAISAILSSNIVDLTFVFGVITLFTGTLEIATPILRRESVYLLLLALPFLLGFDGTISRLDGAVLVLGGVIFMTAIAAQQDLFRKRVHREHVGLAIRLGAILAVSLLVMTVSANFTVSFVSLLAQDVGISTVLIAVFVIGVGTCLPELLFSIRTIQKGRPTMALGNILGVVMIDATIMLGGMAIVHPLVMSRELLRTIAFFNILGAVALIYFLGVHKRLGRWEALVLLGVYASFVATQLYLL